MEKIIYENLDDFDNNDNKYESLASIVTTLEKNPNLKNKILNFIYESGVFLKSEEFRDYYIENKNLINDLFDKYEIDTLVKETFEFSMLNNEVYMFPEEVLRLMYDKLLEGDTLIKNSPLLKVINSCNMIYYDNVYLAMFLINYKII